MNIQGPSVIVIKELVQGPPGPPGLPGPPGPPGGGSGGGSSFSGIAGEILSGHRLVEYNASGLLVYSSGFSAVGLTAASALAGAVVEVFPAGALVEPSWNWTPGQPIFQTGLGQLTQVLPVSGFIRQVAIAQSATSIVIDLQPATILI